MVDSNNLKMGVVAGNFDILHPGYIKLFQECKRNCEYFTILLHNDPSIERPDTKLQPVLDVYDRVEMLKHLRSVDDVIVYDTEEQLVEVLKILEPSVRFLGDDYKDKHFTGDHLNIPIHWIDRSHGWSTTKLKYAIAESVKKYEELSNNK